MICKDCKTELKEDLSLSKGVFGYYKTYNYFCLSCEFEFIKKYKISKEQYFNLLEIDLIKAGNNQKLTTEKTYNQNYKKEGLN